MMMGMVTHLAVPNFAVYFLHFGTPCRKAASYMCRIMPVCCGLAFSAGLHCLRSECIVFLVDVLVCLLLIGITLTTLWKRLEERKPVFSLKIDDSCKEYLWTSVISQHDGLTFFELETARPALATLNRQNSEEQHSVSKCKICFGEVFRVANCPSMTRTIPELARSPVPDVVVFVLELCAATKF